MLIAVEGCAHGELDQIYYSIQNLERQRNVKVDLLICCGDFQAVRNESDLQCMAVPNKFKHMCSFYRYYSGEAKAPMLTLFIGGNHEASNFLQELPYGGWVAPNIYYLGYAGVVTIGGIRIAGISGIYKGHDYLKGHFEIPPYNQGTMRSAYHIRNLEVFRLKQMKDHIDIFISHDWPRGIYNYGNTEELLRWKPYFRDEIASNTLGSQPAETLLHDLKPKHWFAAHLHVKFCATVQHDEERTTQFMALDKCLPRRKYLELVEIPHNSDVSLALCYDPQWLAILKSTNHLLSVLSSFNYMPGPQSTSGERWDFSPTEEEMIEIKKKFSDDFQIPQNFTATVEVYHPENRRRFFHQPKAAINPQTIELCKKLGIDDPFAKLMNSKRLTTTGPPPPVANPDEIAIDDEDDNADQEESTTSSNPNDLFFIDTKPKRSKLTLPEPVNSDEFLEGQDLAGSKTSDKSDGKLEETRPSDVETKSDAAVVEPPMVRTLKRRNQDLYSINPEDY